MAKKGTKQLRNRSVIQESDEDLPINQRSASRSDRSVPATSVNRLPVDSDSIDSHHNPYYLQSGDHPGMSIVTEILTGDNYNSWLVTMQTSLEAKNKISFVDGSLPRPLETDPLFKIWTRCNSMMNVSSKTAKVTEIPPSSETSSSGLKPTICQITGTFYPSIFCSPSAENTYFYSLSDKIVSLNTWVIDTGATHHVTYDKDLYQQMIPIHDTTMKLPNGVGVKIAGLGTIRLSDRLILHNVLYIPQFKFHLLSDPSRALMIGKGRLQNKLYFLDLQFQPSEDIKPTVCAIIKNDFKTWHQRLGHLSHQKLQSLSGSLSVSFPKTVTPEENHLDDHSRATWVYLLKNKSDVITILPGFVAMIETQFQVKIKGVRSDNAPELNFTQFYKEKGIIAYHSCPETPQQNSVVERNHQHLLNVARALMFQSHLPIEF
ncbi:Integrase catalytic core [Arabidopsis suecica]|uniref:Integrase catalytic core n=1 Tax=Arabidopsis suecica TaxID=45249 RepID=A0A8T1XQX7_ARASU|nr:Integrase catalytic core [Arabidopsis suecica]